jgi:small subunit ribosomal protein S8
MPHTDPISDLMTRIRNAFKAGLKNVTVPASSEKTKILEIMIKEGYVGSFRMMKDKGKSFLDIELKYKADGTSSITSLKRLSKPGLRRYSGYKKIPIVKNGLGIVILSTPRGIMSDRMARKEKLGGELICSIF